MGFTADPKEHGSVYRGTIIGSTTDPLSVIDKALEIKDPELGGVALAGKVTWFDPKRSRYCIVSGGGGGSGAISSGSGEPKEGCSRWITVDKLVEAKAIGVQRSGKRFTIEQVPSPEGEDRAAGQDCVKIERHDEEDEEGNEAHTLSAADEGENKEEAREREGVASVGLKEAGSNEEDAATTTAGKRRRTDTLPSRASPSDIAPADHPAIRPKEQSPLAPAPLERGSQPTRMASEEAVEIAHLLCPRGEGPESPTEVKVASESGAADPRSVDTEKRSTASRSPTPQQTRLLPSVQFQEQSDGFSRYPIRGRRRRPENLAFDPNEQRGLDVPSSKRPRLEGEADERLDVAADAGPDSPITELACPGEATVLGDLVHAAEVARHESRSTFDLRPGWPHGMGLLGQVPVMRVRTVRVLGGGDVTYFASAYASFDKGVVCDKRPTPGFSFPFEELEAMTTGGAKQPQRDTHADQPCNLPEELQGREGGENILDHAGIRKTREAEAARMPPSSELGQEQENQKEEESGVDQTSNVSSDSEDAEDGEVGTLSSERADAMPPSPSCENPSVCGGVERLSPADKQVVKEGATNNEQTVQPACQIPSVTGEDESATNAKEVEEMEEMEISSDDVSCGGFEGAEAASPCISEDDDDDDDDVNLRWDVFRVGGSPARLARVDAHTADPLLGATSAASPSATETTQALLGPLSVESDEDAEKSESLRDGVVSDQDDQTGPKSNGVEATPSDQQASAAMAGGTAMPGLEGELPATQQEPEVATAEPIAPQQTGLTLALRSIVREQLQGVLKSASKGEEAALAGGDGNDVLERIASDTEGELFGRLYKDITGGREYKVGYSSDALGLVFSQLFGRSSACLY